MGESDPDANHVLWAGEAGGRFLSVNQLGNRIVISFDDLSLTIGPLELVPLPSPSERRGTTEAEVEEAYRLNDPDSLIARMALDIWILDGTFDVERTPPSSEERQPDFRICNDCGFANGHHAAKCLRCESGDLIDAYRDPEADGG